jgi:hypothetical protein
MAVRVYNTVLHIDARKLPISARDAMFRPSADFYSADFSLHGNRSDPRIDSLRVHQATAFNKGLFAPNGPQKTREYLSNDNQTQDEIYVVS